MLSAKVGLRSTALELGHSLPLEYSVWTEDTLNWRELDEQLRVSCGSYWEHHTKWLCIPCGLWWPHNAQEEVNKRPTEACCATLDLEQVPDGYVKIVRDCFSSKHIRWEWPLASIEVKFESCAQAETNLRGDWRKYWEHHQLHSIIWGLAHDKGVTCSQTRDHIVYNCKPLQYNELPINQLRHHGSVSRCVMLCSWSRLREFIRSFTTTQLMTNNLTEELPRDMLGAKI